MTGNRNAKRGFTLVELLITISIIVLLSTIGIITYSQVFKNGRDAKRQSDLKQIQSALEQYRADQGFYPPAINFATAVSLTNCTGKTPPPPCTVNKTYLKEIPHDPIGSPEYDYKAYKELPSALCTSTDCFDYCLYAKVENSANEKDTACSDDLFRKLEVTKP